MVMQSKQVGERPRRLAWVVLQSSDVSFCFLLFINCCCLSLIHPPFPPSPRSAPFPPCLSRIPLSPSSSASIAVASTSPPGGTSRR